MQHVSTLSVNYDEKHVVLPATAVERTRLCESVCAALDVNSKYDD